MTKITFFHNTNHEYQRFVFQDHAGYADEGEDIVCAGISTLVINFINSIERLTPDTIDVQSNEKEAVIRVKLPKSYSERTDVLLQSLILGVTEIAESYPDFVDLLFEED